PVHSNPTTITQRPKTPVPTEPAAKGLTPKQRQAIGVAALAVCLIVGAGIVWWFLFGASPKRRTVTVDPSKQTMALPGGGGQMRVMPRPRDMRGVTRVGDGKWFARGDNGGMQISKNGDGTYRMLFQFPI